MENLDLITSLVDGTKKYTSNRIEREVDRNAYLAVLSENFLKVREMNSLDARVFLNTQSVRLYHEVSPWYKHSTVKYRILAVDQLYDIVDRIEERFG